MKVLIEQIQQGLLLQPCNVTFRNIRTNRTHIIACDPETGTGYHYSYVGKPNVNWRENVYPIWDLDEARKFKNNLKGKIKYVKSEKIELCKNQ